MSEWIPVSCSLQILTGALSHKIPPEIFPGAIRIGDRARCKRATGYTQILYFPVTTCPIWKLKNKILDDIWVRSADEKWKNKK